MEKSDAINQISVSCRAIARELTRIQSTVADLNDPHAQDQIYKAVFEVSTGVEALKKHLVEAQKKS